MGFLVLGLEGNQRVHFKKNISYKIVLNHLQKREVINKDDLIILKKALEDTQIKFPILSPKQIELLENKIAHIVFDTPQDICSCKVGYGPIDYDLLDENIKRVARRLWRNRNDKIEMICNILIYFAIRGR